MHDDNISIEKNIIKENSSSLWHKKLAYISLERIKRLVNNEILKDIDILTSKCAQRKTEILEFIYTNICSPFFTPYFNGQRCFILFIDNHIKYMYLYLLFEKSEILDTFKVYKVEIEKQIDKKIKIV